MFNKSVNTQVSVMQCCLQQWYRASCCGSLSSSTSDFLEATQPTLAVVATGYQNPSKRPRKLVRQRYNQLVDTQQAGAVLVRLGEKGIVHQKHWRAENKRFWHLAEGCLYRD